jgi:hypothetical protein
MPAKKESKKCWKTTKNGIGHGEPTQDAKPKHAEPTQSQANKTQAQV